MSRRQQSNEFLAPIECSACGTIFTSRILPEWMGYPPVGIPHCHLCREGWFDATHIEPGRDGIWRKRQGR